MIHVKYIPCLFDASTWIEFESRNLTIITVMQTLFRKYPEVRDDGPATSVRVNGKILSPFLWKTKELKDGDRVTIIQEIGGTIIATLATAIGVVGAGVAAGGVLGISAVTLGTVINVIVCVASIIYSIVSAVTAPGAKSSYLGTTQTGQGLINSPTYGWEGARTQVKSGIPVPIVYGQHLTGGSVCRIISESF